MFSKLPCLMFLLLISFKSLALEVFCKQFYKSSTVQKMNQNEYRKLTSRAMPFDRLNRKFQIQALSDPSLSEFIHKLSNPFILDNTTNYLSLAKGIVEDLQAMPQKLERFSTLSKEVLESRNRIALELLTSQERKEDGIDLSVVQNLLENAKKHPVVGIDALLKYDLNTATNKRVHGFCFGRADYLYYELLKLGVPKTSIYKLFQVGSINGDKDFGRNWSNHIVTIVRVKDIGWLAIDPLYGELMTPAQWYEKNQSAANLGKSLLYIGNPERMYTQGGESHFPGIADLNFPSGRTQLTAPDKDGTPTAFESYFVFKDIFWQRYYNDLLTSVLEDNNGPFAGYFCQVTGLCRTDKK